MTNRAATKLAKDIEELCDSGWVFDNGFREALRRVYARHEVFLPKTVSTEPRVLEYRAAMSGSGGEFSVVTLGIQTEKFAAQLADNLSDLGDIVFAYYGEDL